MKPDIEFDVKELKAKSLSKIDLDNVKFFDNLVKSKGKLYTLDTKPYIDFLTDMGVNFKTTLVK